MLPFILAASHPGFYKNDQSSRNACLKQVSRGILPYRRELDESFAAQMEADISKVVSKPLTAPESSCGVPSVDKHTELSLQWRRKYVTSDPGAILLEKHTPDEEEKAWTLVGSA